MKSKVKRYVQMSFQDFVRTFPEAAEMLRDMPMYEHFLNDPLYIVRIAKNGKIEIGYKEDAWQIR